MWPWCSTGNKVAAGRVLLFLWLSPCRARGRCLGVTLVLPPLAEELHSQTPQPKNRLMGTVRHEDPPGGLAVWQSQRQCQGWHQCLGTVPAGSQGGPALLPVGTLCPRLSTAAEERAPHTVAVTACRSGLVCSVRLHIHRRTNEGETSLDSSEGTFHLPRPHVSQRWSALVYVRCQKGMKRRKMKKQRKEKSTVFTVFENCTCFLL